MSDAGTPQARPGCGQQAAGPEQRSTGRRDCAGGVGGCAWPGLACPQQGAGGSGRTTVLASSCPAPLQVGALLGMVPADQPQAPPWHLQSGCGGGSGKGGVRSTPAPKPWCPLLHWEKVPPPSTGRSCQPVAQTLVAMVITKALGCRDEAAAAVNRKSGGAAVPHPMPMGSWPRSNRKNRVGEACSPLPGGEGSFQGPPHCSSYPATLPLLTGD